MSPLETISAELTTGTVALPLPLRFVSDWHLGHPGSRIQEVAQVEALLQGVGTLVMVGDGREELVEQWRAKADWLWNELQQNCQQRGIHFIALTGNHDPEASRDGWMTLEGGRILVTHGDMIYETSSPWSRELFANRERVDSFLSGVNCSSLRDRWECAQQVGYLLRPNTKMDPTLFGYFKLALWPPQRLLEIIKTWRNFPREGVSFLARFCPKAEVLICGHFHRPGRFTRNGKIVWNLGSQMRMSKCLVLDYRYEGENLVLSKQKIGGLK